ncbi:MAG: glycosyltransferase family 4 protein [Bryobacteraceae bacterium]|nr:glycosyltransferase family 4 protein [Bryobacteraceae bacterium]
MNITPDPQTASPPPPPRAEAASLGDRRLCFAGPMVGRRPGFVTTQGQKLSELMAREGARVISVSALPNRYMRAADILLTLARRLHDVDAVFIDIYGGPSFLIEDAASALASKYGCPIIMVLHGGALPEFMARRTAWVRRVLGRAARLVAPSPYLARAVAPLGLNVELIPNVIELKDYPYRRRDKLAPRLFWMRAFHPIWNPELAIRVLHLLRPDYPDATLVLAGQEKGLLGPMKELASRLDLAEAIEFPGFLGSEEKARYGNQADIYLNTNRIDNMPVSVVEACAMGIPVVATDVGGIGDLLRHEETALLTPDNDAGSMAGAVRRLLAEPELAASLSSNGRILAARSAWENVLPRWRQVLAEVCANN